MYKIYVIKNTINNKLYIGQTKQSLKKRFIGHKTKSNSGSKSPIHCAIRLYGVENFKIELVCESNSLEETNSKEVEYIKQFNSIAPNGYNILEGGASFPKIHGPFTEEHKNKIKDAHKKNSKPIIQFDIKTGNLIREWPSSKDLLREGFGRANIISLCKSLKTFGYIYGYGWCYKITYESIIDKTALATPFYNPNGVTIKCLDINNNLIKIYYKMVDAAKELKCSPSSISDCLSGRTKTCKGYKWEYL